MNVGGTGSEYALNEFALWKSGPGDRQLNQEPDASLYLMETTSTRVVVRAVGDLGGVDGFDYRQDTTVYGAGKLYNKMHFVNNTGAALTDWEVNWYNGSDYSAEWKGLTETEGVLSDATEPNSYTEAFALRYTDNASPTDEHYAGILFIPSRDYTEFTDAGEGWIWKNDLAADSGYIKLSGTSSFASGETRDFYHNTVLKPDTIESAAAAQPFADDYRTPDVLSITNGDHWNDANEHTSADDFNEAEGVYTLETDASGRLTFDIDGNSEERRGPAFKIREWRSLESNPTVTLESNPLAKGVDYRADVKPVTLAPFAQELIWYTTMQNATRITGPDVGSAGAINNGPLTYSPGKYGMGALINGANQSVTFDNTSFNVVEGMVEFWFQPTWLHTDNTSHVLWFNQGSSGEFFLIEKTATNNLEFGISNGVNTRVRVLSANYSWLAGEWVHIRVTWDESAPAGARLHLYLNGKEPIFSYQTGPFTSAGMNMVTNWIGNSPVGNQQIAAVVDEFHMFSSIPPSLAHGGLIGHSEEKLADSSVNEPLEFTAADAQKRGSFLYMGTDSRFLGLNIALATAGTGSPNLVWEYWAGSGWGDLEASGFFDETNHFTEPAGTVYWSAPGDWELYSLSGGPELFYVRVHLANSTSYTVDPVEGLIKTDILLFHYCGDITASAQTFDISPALPTAVELLSFDAEGLDGEVILRWETGSEIDNLGFHVYRAPSGSGPYTRITSEVIPGLGNSPAGAQYSYRDAGLANGTTYYYKLEDIETNGRVEIHGPVSASPSGGNVETESPGGEGEPSSLITIGNPSENRLRILEQRAGELVLELVTNGFYAEPVGDGTVRLDIPGFDWMESPNQPTLPVKRAWVEAIAGREVRLVSVESLEKERFDGLRPHVAGEQVVEVSAQGVLRVRRARAARRTRVAYDRAGASLYPPEGAHVASVGYQGDVKKVLVELAPIRWDGDSAQLLVFHRLVVRLKFEGRDLADQMSGGRRGRRYRTEPSPEPRRVTTRWVTAEAGLYGVDLRQLLRSRDGMSIDAGALRLSRQGESVPFHVEGSTLYFVSVGGEGNPYGHEAVYELEVGVSGDRMATASGAPGGAPTPYYWELIRKEEDLIYQSALVEAPDRWLWRMLFAPARESFGFEV
jgi:hypothetical protein